MVQDESVLLDNLADHQGGSMISILLPTRKRIPKLAQMMKSASDTAQQTFELVIYVDDDPETDSMFFSNWTGVAPEGTKKLTVLHGEKRRLAEYWNDCAAAATGDILMLANDDLVFHTPGWSEKIEAAFAESQDKILCVHADNGQPNAASFCTHPFIHRKWVDAVGYFVPPQFEGDFTDTWIWDVANRINRRVYLPDVKIEHLHHIYQKSQMDDTYRERLAMEKQGHYARLFDTMAPERERDAEKLRKVML